MSALFDRLQRVFDDGHGIELPDLLTDARFIETEPRPAAVLVAVTDRPQPGLILTQRLHDMRDHPGQVALPGGGTKLVMAPEGVKAGETIKVTVKVPVD